MEGGEQTQEGICPTQVFEVSSPHLQGPVRGRQVPSYPKCSGLMQNGLQGAVQALGKMAWAWMASGWGGDNLSSIVGS